MPISYGDPEGSTLAVMLFPDDLATAKAWHARWLAAKPLPQYLAAGHDFTDRLPELLSDLTSNRGQWPDAEDRFRRASHAAGAIKVLWAMVCTDRRTNRRNASWTAAIKYAAAHAGKHQERASVSFIRQQLRLFAPVLHLWGAWDLLGRDLGKPAADLFSVSHDLLFELRHWQAARFKAHNSNDGYLNAEEFGPWPGLSLQAGVRIPAISLPSRSAI